MTGFPRFSEPRPEELDEFALSESEMSLRERRAAEAQRESRDPLGQTSDEEDPCDSDYDERRDLPEGDAVARVARDVNMTAPGPANYPGRADVGFRAAEQHDVLEEPPPPPPPDPGDDVDE